MPAAHGLNRGHALIRNAGRNIDGTIFWKAALKLVKLYLIWKSLLLNILQMMWSNQKHLGHIISWQTSWKINWINIKISNEKSACERRNKRMNKIHRAIQTTSFKNKIHILFRDIWLSVWCLICILWHPGYFLLRKDFWVTIYFKVQFALLTNH